MLKNAYKILFRLARRIWKHLDTTIEKNVLHDMKPVFAKNMFLISKKNKKTAQICIKKIFVKIGSADLDKFGHKNRNKRSLRYEARFCPKKN